MQVSEHFEKHAMILSWTFYPSQIEVIYSAGSILPIQIPRSPIVLEMKLMGYWLLKKKSFHSFKNFYLSDL